MHGHLGLHMQTHAHAAYLLHLRRKAASRNAGKSEFAMHLAVSRHKGNLCHEADACHAWQALQPKDAALASDLTAAPEDSESGDTLIKLDDSTTLRAHALHLKKASSVFQFALQACDMPAPEGRKRKAPHDGDGVLYRLPLPCVNARQAMLLLHYLYSDVPESWTAALEISDLVRLAEVANQCACLSLLKLVDSTMVKHSTAQEAHHTTSAGPAILTAKTAPEQLSLAGKLNLEVYQAHVGCYIGRHASEIDLSLLEPSLKHALGGALEAQAKLLASMSS